MLLLFAAALSLIFSLPLQALLATHAAIRYVADTLPLYAMLLLDDDFSLR